MKRTLFATTALATAGLLALSAGDAFAQAAAPAAEKLKISMGGFMQQTAGYAQQDSDWEEANGVYYKGFDQKSDSEIYASGSVKLDNGLTVSVRAEFEADVSTGGGMDASYLTVASPTMGTLTIGNTDAAVFYLGVQAPWAGLNPYDGTLGSWVIAPTGSVATSGSTTFSGAADDNRIEYRSPSLAGFTIGGGYAPETTADTETQPLVGAGDVYNLGIQYSGKFDGFGARASATAWRNDGGAETSQTDNWQVGADVTVADFTIGAAYGEGEHDGPAQAAATSVAGNHETWNVGVKYAPGPFEVALTYGQRKASNTGADSDDDTHSRLSLGAEYTLGPGVALIGDIMRLKYTDETGAQASENTGWAVVGGLNVSF